MDAHEALITRHDVEKLNESLRDLIFNACNVVLVHHRCHMRIMGHGGDDGFEKCADHLVMHEGKDRVRGFLVAMLDHAPEVAKNALQRFDKMSF